MYKTLIRTVIELQYWPVSLKPWLKNGMSLVQEFRSMTSLHSWRLAVQQWHEWSLMSHQPSWILQFTCLVDPEQDKHHWILCTLQTPVHCTPIVSIVSQTGCSFALAWSCSETNTILFETDDGVSLCVWVKYSDSESYLEEMKLSNGENIFIAQPEREFEVMVTSAGTCRKKLCVDCCLGKSLQHDTQQQQLSIVVNSIKPLQPLSISILLFRVGSTDLNSVSCLWPLWP